MGDFFIEAYGIKVRVERRKVKCIRLYIKPPDGSAFISMPQRCSIDSVRKFIESKRGWIEEKQAQCRARSAQTLSTQQACSTVLLWGNQMTLEVDETAGKDLAEPAGERIVIRTKNSADEHTRMALLDEMYRRLLCAELPSVTEKWQSRMGVKALEWRIKKMKTRWGTCNVEKKRIWINLRLAMLPPECLEYVVVHELCHLYEPGHNQQFWALMSMYMPEWKEIRVRMKDFCGVLY